MRNIGFLLRLRDMTAAEDTALAAVLPPQTPDTPALAHSAAMFLIRSYFFIIDLSVSYR